jgi:hypothetical protein
VAAHQHAAVHPGDGLADALEEFGEGGREGGAGGLEQAVAAGGDDAAVGEVAHRDAPGLDLVGQEVGQPGRRRRGGGGRGRLRRGAGLEGQDGGEGGVGVPVEGEGGEHVHQRQQQRRDGGHRPQGQGLAQRAGRTAVVCQAGESSRSGSPRSFMSIWASRSRTVASWARPFCCTR